MRLPLMDVSLIGVLVMGLPPMRLSLMDVSP